MNGKKAKAIRKQLRKEGIPISAEPYSGDKTKVSSYGRRLYQSRKELK